MRQGRKMPDELWDRLKAQAVEWESTDARLHDDRMNAGHEGAFIWEIVSRLQHLRAMRDATKAGQRLYYVQAVDQYAHNVNPMSRTDA